jgi:hypothetical protein
MRDLLRDEDGENRAVRTFLMQWGLPGLTVGAMAQHMNRSGWPFEYWPDFARKVDNAGQHLTKAGAQIWIRHLFSLEGAELAAGAAAGGEHKDVAEGPVSLKEAVEQAMCDIIKFGGKIHWSGPSSTAPAAGTEKDAERLDWRSLGYVEGTTVRQKVSTTRYDYAVITCVHENGALDVVFEEKTYGWSARHCTPVAAIGAHTGKPA